MVATSPLLMSEPLVSKPAPASGKPARKPRAARMQDPQRMQSVLSAAAAEFNTHGIAGAVLGNIAKRVEIKRAALYYYVENRDELAWRCYLQTCEILRSDLAQAAATRGKGMARLQAFLRTTTDPARPAVAAPSEIPYLAPERRREIEQQHARNVAALRALIAGGIEDGSIRACDTQVVANTLLGMLFWIPLSESWVEGIDLRGQAGPALCELVARGISADRDAPFECRVDVAMFAPKFSNLFDKRTAHAMRLEQLTRAASQLFNRQGIDGTSLDEITARLGATKGAFYHYVTDKNELVVRCYERAYRLYNQFAEAAARGRNGRERALLGLHLNVQAQASGLSPLPPLTGVESLPAAARKRLRKQSGELEQRFEGFAREGVADGSLRSYDLTSVAVVGAGAFGWIPKWLGENDPRGAHAIADEIVALFSRGLEQRR
jgi:AcrR family transcriptional regulator